MFLAFICSRIRQPTSLYIIHSVCSLVYSDIGFNPLWPSALRQGPLDGRLASLRNLELADMVRTGYNARVFKS